MAVRNDFTAGEVLAAADLNDTFASKLPYSYGTATPSTTDSGFLWYDSNSTPAATKYWDGSAFVPFGGKILQVVRATDSTDRSTTSTSYVDASISVSITPQKTDSAILLIWNASFRSPAANASINFQITDASNNAISGTDDSSAYSNDPTYFVTATLSTFGYDTPATTSAVTYKGRFRVSAGTGFIRNSSDNPGQLFAIEVSA